MRYVGRISLPALPGTHLAETSRGTSGVYGLPFAAGFLLLNRPSLNPPERWEFRALVMTLKQNFATNLRLLCGQHRSVSEVCRRLAINRQQFNKYLAGTSLPSSATLGRVCAFFRVDQGEILLAPDEFAALAGARPRDRVPATPPLFAPTIGQIAARFPDSSRKL